MTESEAKRRAAELVQEYHGRRSWGYDPNQHAEYEQLIAAALLAAAREGERSGAARIRERAAIEAETHDLVCGERDCIAADIRALDADAPAVPTFVACEEDRPVPVAVEFRELKPLLDPDVESPALPDEATPKNRRRLWSDEYSNGYHRGYWDSRKAAKSPDVSAYVEALRPLAFFKQFVPVDALDDERVLLIGLAYLQRGDGAAWISARHIRAAAELVLARDAKGGTQ